MGTLTLVLLLVAALCMPVSFARWRRGEQEASVRPFVLAIALAFVSVGTGIAWAARVWLN
jgi:hypothetical protein